MAPGTLFCLTMALWAALWLPAAYFIDQTLLPGQMMQRFGTGKVIPAVADFFIWADIFWLPWILGYIVAKEGNQWSRWDVICMGLLGLVLTCLFQKFVVLTGEWPATLGWKGRTTFVGGLHIPYMSVALAILGLHFFRSSVEPQTALVVGIALVVQIGLDLHLPVKFIQDHYQFVWYPNILGEDAKQLWMLAGGFSAVVAFSLLSVFL